MSMNGQGRYGISHRSNHLDYYRLPSRAVTEKRIEGLARKVRIAKKNKDADRLLVLQKRYLKLLDELRRSI